ncbi:hypothetical protein LCGC14_0478650 [marine sediment metagenome]|uniref:Uncharacterized protein n=1 Tax=marine sediment metagenome TaxID=412755 RepID=A0A0F9UX00_9ZZZZ
MSMQRIKIITVFRSGSAEDLSKLQKKVNKFIETPSVDVVHKIQFITEVNRYIMTILYNIT